MTLALPRRLLSLLIMPLALVLQGPVRAEGTAPEPSLLTVQTTGDSRLNLRAEASVTAEVVGQLGAGSAVRNLGCKTVGDRRWCRIAAQAGPAVEGWAAAEYLLPAAALPEAAPDSPSTAETACLGAVAEAAKDSDVEVLALDDSQPEVLVQVGVGPERAPWQCLAAADGSTRGVEYLGPAGDVADAIAPAEGAEAACRAAVAQAAGNGLVMAMSSAPVAAGFRVRLLVGADSQPWTCIARPDGTVAEIARMGG